MPLQYLTYMVQQKRFSKENTVNYILTKIPEYEDSWQQHLEYWKDNDKRSIFLDLDNFSTFTIIEIENKRFDLLSKIFEMIEKLIEYGDEDIDYAATIMFLEGLIFTSEHQPDTVSHKIFLPLLGLKFKEFCKELSPSIFEY